MDIWNNPSYSNFTLKDKDANQTLRRGCYILDKLKYFYWLSAGTALGIYRDEKLIESDTDIDVEVFDHDGRFSENKDAIIDIFYAKDFDFLRLTKDEDRIYQLAFYDKKTEVVFDIYTYYLSGEKIVSKSELNGEIWYPKQFMHQVKVIDFKGGQYPVIEQEPYLQHVYGDDWITPKSPKDTTFNWGRNENKCSNNN